MSFACAFWAGVSLAKEPMPLPTPSPLHGLHREVDSAHSGGAPRDSPAPVVCRALFAIIFRCNANGTARPQPAFRQPALLYARSRPAPGRRFKPPSKSTPHPGAE